MVSSLLLSKIQSIIMIRHVQVIISGKVENTGFRLYALRGASEMNIKGQVKQKSGMVLIEAEGEESHLEKFITWCKNGPVGCVVGSTEIIEKKVIGYQDFNIL